MNVFYDDYLNNPAKSFYQSVGCLTILSKITCLLDFLMEYIYFRYYYGTKFGRIKLNVGNAIWLWELRTWFLGNEDKNWAQHVRNRDLLDKYSRAISMLNYFEKSDFIGRGQSDLRLISISNTQIGCSSQSNFRSRMR